MLLWQFYVLLMEDYYTIDLTAKIIKLLGQSVHGSVGSRSHCQSLERLGSSWASECVLSDRYAVDRLWPSNGQMRTVIDPAFWPCNWRNLSFLGSPSAGFLKPIIRWVFGPLITRDMDLVLILLLRDLTWLFRSLLQIIFCITLLAPEKP